MASITINEKLQWTEHISNITKRLVHHWNSYIEIKKGPPFIKNVCNKSLIIPTLEYACTIWYPYILKDIPKIDKIQRRTARFV